MAENSRKKQASRQWVILFLLISLIGAGVSVELTNIYIRVRLDPEYESFCAVSDLANCDTVAVSKYSSLFKIPVSIWGLSAYAGMIVLCLWGLISRLRPVAAWPLPLLFGASVFSVCTSLVLFGISAFTIKSFCPLCMTIYGLNFVLLLIAVFGMRAGGIKTLEDIISHARDSMRRARLTVSGSIIAALLMASVVAGYEIIYGQVPVDLPKGPGGLPVGVDENGNYWIGARNPKLVIEEFSDYQCPFCRKAHQKIRRWVAKNAEHVRLVHRHLPLDHHCNPLVTRPYHIYACDMARTAYCAGEQERFWEMNDYLYALPLGDKPPKLDVIALDLNLDAWKLKSCLASDYCEDCLMRDIEFCVNRNIKSTPTLFMNGKMYPGGIKKKDLEEALQKTLTEN